MDGVSEKAPGGSIRSARGNRTSENRLAGAPANWAKPADAENIAVAAAVREAFGIAHRMGITDAAITRLICRDGRRLSVHSVRAWRESHRCNVVSMADALRLVSVLPEEAARPIVDLFTEAAGMVAIDLPEPGAGDECLVRAALDVGTQTGELGAAIAEATADGQLTGDERERIGREAWDVMRAAGWARESAGARS